MTQSRCGQSPRVASGPPTALSSLSELPFFGEGAEVDAVEALAEQLQAATEAFSKERRQLRALLRRRKHLEAQFQLASEASRSSAKAVESAVEDARRWLHVDLPYFLAGSSEPEPTQGHSDHRGLEALRQKSSTQAAELQRLAQKCAALQQAGHATDAAMLSSLQTQMLRERVAHQDQLKDLRERRAELLRSLGGGTAGPSKKRERERQRDTPVSRSWYVHDLAGYCNYTCSSASVQAPAALSLCRIRSPFACSTSVDPSKSILLAASCGVNGAFGVHARNVEVQAQDDLARADAGGAAGLSADRSFRQLTTMTPLCPGLYLQKAKTSPH